MVKIVKKIIIVLVLGFFSESVKAQKLVCDNEFIFSQELNGELLEYYQALYLDYDKTIEKYSIERIESLSSSGDLEVLFAAEAFMGSRRTDLDQLESILTAKEIKSSSELFPLYQSYLSVFFSLNDKTNESVSATRYAVEAMEIIDPAIIRNYVFSMIATGTPKDAQKFNNKLPKDSAAYVSNNIWIQSELGSSISYEEKEKLLKKIYQDCPKDDEYSLDYGFLLYEKGNLEGAMNISEHVASLSQYPPPANDQLKALLEFELGNYKEALKYLNQISEQKIYHSKETIEDMVFIYNRIFDFSELLKKQRSGHFPLILSGVFVFFILAAGIFLYRKRGREEKEMGEGTLNSDS